MRRVALFGRVIPERGYVSINETIQVGLAASPASRVAIAIFLSQVNVVADFPEGDMTLEHFKNQIEGAVRSIVDAIGYVKLCGYEVEIVSCIDVETGVQTLFRVNPPIDVNGDLPAVGTILPPAIDDVALRLALVNFRLAIRMPGDTSHFCYRAIECIRQAFTEDDKEKAGWAKMRQGLLLKKTTLKELTPHATALRHGKYAQQTWDTRKRHMEIVHEVIRRYFHWKVAEDGALPEFSFPEF